MPDKNDVIKEGKEQLILPEAVDAESDSAVQKEFRQLCRLGDLDKLNHLLRSHPEVRVDGVCPSEGGTALHEAVTKNAQFTGIVAKLLDFGAQLQVTDSLGNSPLHNAVLYHPSTQDTVDLLLARGADTAAKNLANQTPVTLADDRDLKEVLKKLKRVGKRPSATYSPDLRRKVITPVKNHFKVIFNNKSEPASPGLLKKRFDIEGCPQGGRKRRSEDEEEEGGGGRRIKSRRIRWCQEENSGVELNMNNSAKFTKEGGDGDCGAGSIQSNKSNDLVGEDALKVESASNILEAVTENTKINNTDVISCTDTPNAFKVDETSTEEKSNNAAEKEVRLETFVPV